MNYRHEAQLALDRAKENIKKNDIYAIRYAALELRMALEALIYQKSKNYKDELPEKDMDTWQPRQLLIKLIEIDPDADKGASVAVGIEEEYGQPAKEMNFIGSERVLSLAEIKKYYDRLGSYLHTPTLKQIKNNKTPSKEKIHDDCDGLASIIDEVLLSTIFDVDFKRTMDWECNKCHTKIVRRIHHEREGFLANCIQCSASYSIKLLKEDTYQITPLTKRVPCSNSSCRKTTDIWENDIKLNEQWECEHCNTKNIFVLAVTNLDKINKS